VFYWRMETILEMTQLRFMFYKAIRVCCNSLSLVLAACFSFIVTFQTVMWLVADLVLLSIQR
jgi:hypothetical protein